MAINGKIRDEKLKFDINRKTAKVSELLLCKIDKYECLAFEDMLRFN